MKIYHTLWAILLFTSVALQYNDPDPEVWMPIYGIPGLLSILEIFDWPESGFRLRSWLWAVCALGSVLYGAIHFEGFPPEWYNDEITREALGLFLITFHSVVSYLIVRWIADRRSNAGT
ncbi:MAG: transmembrane 220 family protein, partial [Leptospiraceae bacterium]|nr:transmembrane 220 family protein [Leptospiraceae bacterium]